MTVQHQSESIQVPFVKAGPSARAMPIQVEHRNFETEPIIKELNWLLTCAKSFDQLLANLPNLICKNCDCLGIWYSTVGENGAIGETVPVIDKNEDTLGLIETEKSSPWHRLLRRENSCTSNKPSKTDTNSFLCPFFLVMRHFASCPGVFPSNNNRRSVTIG